jgi:hypothetical protein
MNLSARTALQGVLCRKLVPWWKGSKFETRKVRAQFVDLFAACVPKYGGIRNFSEGLEWVIGRLPVSV